mgnify:CR=1 FL=1|jgi:hypothetical protein
MLNNLVLECINEGGSIKPLFVPPSRSKGQGLMNPSIYVDSGKIIGILRHVNYTFYHSERKLFQHPYGPLTYLHPENDLKLRTWNWYFELDGDLNMTKCIQIDTSKFDTYEPMWEFVGLEDARIFRWNSKLYYSGVRRDTTPNGQGRMELSEIKVVGPIVVESSRVRIDTPNDPDSYCEKNWMPIIDKPYQYVKWTNPTEIIKMDPKTGKSETIHFNENIVSISGDIRGGSQLIPYNDGYIAVIHEVDLFNSREGRKDAIYYHRFIIWDKDWNIINYSQLFHFMNAQVEFCIGMAEYGDSYLFTFGFQDNAAFVLRAKKTTINKFINSN